MTLSRLIYTFSQFISYRPVTCAVVATVVAFWLSGAIDRVMP